MPIYEYKCKKCKKMFELLKPIGFKGKVYCPVCENEAIKVISLSSFHLKGGGWYKDGYTKN